MYIHPLEGLFCIFSISSLLCIFYISRIFYINIYTRTRVGPLRVASGETWSAAQRNKKAASAAPAEASRHLGTAIMLDPPTLPTRITLCTARTGWLAKAAKGEHAVNALSRTNANQLQNIQKIIMTKYTK